MEVLEKSENNDTMYMSSHGRLELIQRNVGGGKEPIEHCHMMKNHPRICTSFLSMAQRMHQPRPIAYQSPILRAFPVTKYSVAYGCTVFARGSFTEPSEYEDSFVKIKKGIKGCINQLFPPDKGTTYLRI